VCQSYLAEVISALRKSTLKWEVVLALQTLNLKDSTGSILGNLPTLTPNRLLRRGLTSGMGSAKSDFKALLLQSK
jgi:hypothetical protein